jgi:hypothetical protein
MLIRPEFLPVSGPIKLSFYFGSSFNIRLTLFQ